MVTVNAYKIRQRKDGSSFVSLELNGDLEILQSSNTGKFYASIAKTFMPSTFTEEVATKMVGKQIEGKIIRVECESYEFTNPNTGEVMTLNHRFGYCPPGSMELVGHTNIGALETA